MEYERFGVEILMSDARMQQEIARRKRVEAALAASTLEMTATQNFDNQETPLLEPRPLLSLDLDRPPQLHPNGRVEAMLSDGSCINIMTRSFGPEDGWPIIFCPGLPASGMPDLPYQRTRDLFLSGLRLIMWDRPGYGDSDRWKGHRVGDGAVLMRAIINAYGIDHCSVAGRSGGGPYALGGGALLPEIVNAAVFACRAPESANIDKLEGASIDNETLLNLADEETLAKSFESTSGEAIIQHPSGVIESILPDLSPSDQRVVREMGVRRYLTESHRNALKHGSEGRIDNVLALRAHWCFELSELGEKRVYVVQGIEGDKFTTNKHCNYLVDTIPNSVPIQRLGMGHMGTMALEMPIFRALSRDSRGQY